MANAKLLFRGHRANTISKYLESLDLSSSTWTIGTLKNKNNQFQQENFIYILVLTISEREKSLFIIAARRPSQRDLFDSKNVSGNKPLWIEQEIHFIMPLSNAYNFAEFTKSLDFSFLLLLHPKSLFESFSKQVETNNIARRLSKTYSSFSIYQLPEK